MYREVNMDYINKIVINWILYNNEVTYNNEVRKSIIKYVLKIVKEPWMLYHFFIA